MTPKVIEKWPQQIAHVVHMCPTVTTSLHVHSGVGYSPQNVHILPFPGAYYRHVSGIYFFQIRKIDGSPSVLHLFRRDWMILKAEMLLYTPVVINSALQQRLCAKNMPEHVYCIPHHHQKYQNKKSCSGMFFAHNLFWRAILTTTGV